MRRMDIEDVVRWAYRDELPKAQRRTTMVASIASSWRSVAMAGMYGQRVDAGHVALNGFGLVPLEGEGEPHPDALRVHEAVLGLDALELDMPEDWDPLGGLGLPEGEAAQARVRALARLVRIDADGVRRLREAPRALVQSRAILGAPELTTETPEASVVTWENGRPRWFRAVEVASAGAFGSVVETIEVDGYDETAKRPHPDAYRKLRYEPDPAEIAVERAAWEVWVAALAVLAEDLAGTLETIDPTGPRRPARPWETGAATGRVLPNLLGRGARGGLRRAGTQPRTDSA